eukprot:scaffold1906_cov106-Isochrysis_galbana.AAC.18
MAFCQSKQSDQFLHACIAYFSAFFAVCMPLQLPRLCPWPPLNTLHILVQKMAWSTSGCRDVRLYPAR